MRSSLLLPIAVSSALATEVGYVGEDVENIILKLLQSVDYNAEPHNAVSSTSTIIDKISRKSESRSR